MRPLLSGFFLFAANLLTANLLSAQQVYVYDRSNNEPMAYAFIYIGGKAIGHADSLGRFDLSGYAVAEGDTISVSFIGMADGHAVYRRSESGVSNAGVGVRDELDARRAGGAERITIGLESDLAIEEIVVHGKDNSMALFRKYVKRTPVADWWFSEFHGSYRIDMEGRGLHSGKFMLVNLPYTYQEITGEKTLTIEPSGDTVGISHILDRAVAASGWGIYSGSVSRWGSFDKGMIIKYKGKQGNFHLFCIIRPWVDRASGQKDSYQTIIYVDDRSKEVVRSESSFVNFLSGSVIKFSTTYRLNDEQDSNLVKHYRVPVTIEGTLNITQSDIDYPAMNARVKLDFSHVSEYEHTRLTKRQIKEAGGWKNYSAPY